MSEVGFMRGRCLPALAAAALLLAAPGLSAQSNPTVPPLSRSPVPPLSSSPVPPLGAAQVPSAPEVAGDIVNPGALAFFHSHRRHFSGFRLREVFLNGERKHLVILQPRRRKPRGGENSGAAHFGVVALSIPQGGTLFSIRTGANRRECEKRNEAYIQRFMADCPQCRLSFSDCGDLLPEEFRPTLENRPIASPYVTWDTIDTGSGDTGSGRPSMMRNRMIFLGLPLELAEELCRRTGEHLKARCISPPGS